MCFSVHNLDRESFALSPFPLVFFSGISTPDTSSDVIRLLNWRKMNLEWKKDRGRGGRTVEVFRHLRWCRNFWQELLETPNLKKQENFGRFQKP
jgi:hypothetical protein